MTQPYWTAEQIAAQIRNGKPLGWLSIRTQLPPDELRTMALAIGYVFGTNGVPRRNADQASLVERDVLDDQADLALDLELDHVFGAVAVLDALELAPAHVTRLAELESRIAEIRRRHANRIRRLEALGACWRQAVAAHEGVER